ncbi:MAG: type II secretion system protein [Archangium sp.]|nr:type II secretion system protein [Archangium sp.]
MRRGFTMVELAIVLTLLAILVPLIFLFFNRGAADFQKANATLEAAEQLRDLSEELRLDARQGALSAAGLTFEGAACGPVSYRLLDTSVVREAPASCGGTRALVRHVREFVRTGPVLTVRIAQLPEDPPITLVLPLGGAR